MEVMQVIVGVMGVFMFGGYAVCSWVIYWNIDRHEDISLAMFFLKDESVAAFKVFASAMSLVAACVLLTGISFVYGWEGIRGVARLGTVSGLIGSLYFYFTIATVTQHPETH